MCVFWKTRTQARNLANEFWSGYQVARTLLDYGLPFEVGSLSGWMEFVSGRGGDVAIRVDGIVFVHV